VGARLIDLDQVWMPHTPRCFGLPAKPVGGVAARAIPGPEHLQRDYAVQRRLSGLIHHAHAAAAQFPEHFVSRNHRPRRRCGCRARPATVADRRLCTTTCNPRGGRFRGRIPGDLVGGKARQATEERWLGRAWVGWEAGE
jgi:hypothetical protein